MKVQRRRERNIPATSTNTEYTNDDISDLSDLDFEEGSGPSYDAAVEEASETVSQSSLAPGSASIERPELAVSERSQVPGRALPKKRRTVQYGSSFGAEGRTRQYVPPAPISAPLRPAPAVRALRFYLTYEKIFWIALFALTVATRFWDVGNRGIHHDESLHSVYSRNLYSGIGYTHDPMMHGPLQFHLIATMYWLFGTADATARFASVTCGIWVVMAPFFLRRQMGRLTAMVCATLLFLSPTVLYFSRMAREDSIFAATETLMLVGLWRFVSTRRPSDFYIFSAGLALMFTIKETSYLTAAILIVFFGLLFAVQSGYAVMGALAVYGAAMGALYLFVGGGMKAGTIPELPNIPVTSPSYDVIVDFVGGLLRHPLVQGALALTVLFAVSLVFLFRMQRARLGSPRLNGRVPPRRRVVTDSAGHTVIVRRASVNGGSSEKTHTGHNGLHELPQAPGDVALVNEEEPAGGYEDGSAAASEAWNPRRLDPNSDSVLGHYQPGSLPYLVGGLFSRPSVLIIGFLIAGTIFTTLYTVFFTDIPRGIVSGLFASVGYWMAQQGVARGGQPWFYYLLLLPLYEPIAAFFSIAASIFFSVKGIRWLLSRVSERRYTEAPRLGAFNTDREVPFAKFSAFLPLFVMFWLLGALLLYSWAGEKMPWLVEHLTRPAIFLASLFIGMLASSLLRRRNERLEAAALYTGATFESASGTTSLTRGQNLPRRRVATAKTAVLVRVQDPPWVAWNKASSRFPSVSFVALFVLFALAWALSMNAQATIATGQNNDYGTWGVTWLFPGLMVALVAGYSVWLGPRRAFRYLALGMLGVMLMYEFRSAVNLAYQQPDVPKEMAVYVQTSPDVTRVMSELDRYSAVATGSKDLKVQYDSFASWPFEWYLRDYKNKVFIGGNDPNPGPQVPVMILEYAKHNNDAKLADYTSQRYAMRWWFPEEWYKNDLIPGQDLKTAPLLGQIGGALHTIGVTIFQPEYQSTLWKYLLFRETPKPLGSEDMLVFIHKTVAQQYHYAQYEAPAFTDAQSYVPTGAQVPQPSVLQVP